MQIVSIDRLSDIRRLLAALPEADAEAVRRDARSASAR